MFEGWATDLLATYLGHFVDVKREALRIGLWSGLVLKVRSAQASRTAH